MYIIKSQDGLKLNRFERGQITENQLRYSNKCYASFGSIEEAEKHIWYIQNNANQKTKPAALRLQVAME